jgi:hypothetical protein
MIIGKEPFILMALFLCGYVITNFDTKSMEAELAELFTVYILVINV